MKSSNKPRLPETLMGGNDEYAGVWDDVATAWKWRPILPLLQKLESAPDTVSRAFAIRNIVAFVLHTGLNRNPDDVPAFSVLDHAITTIATDPMWRETVEKLLGARPAK